MDEVVSLDGMIATIDGKPLPLVAVDGQPDVIRGPADLSPADGTMLLPYEQSDRCSATARSSSPSTAPSTC